MGRSLLPSRTVRPGGCRDDYDRSVTVGEDSESTHGGVRHPRRGESCLLLNGSQFTPNSAMSFCPLLCSGAPREKLQNAWKSSASCQGGSTALASESALRQRARGFSDRRNRRLGWRP